MRQIKLPKGQMNINFVTLKTGYAEGVRRPRRAVKPKEVVPFNPVIIRRAF